MSIRKWLNTVVLAGLLASGSAFGQNTTAAAAVAFPIDVDFLDSYFSTTVGDRWYYIGLIQGRSYCVITSPRQFDIDTATVDTYTRVYSDSAGTVLFQAADDSFNDPSAAFYSRNCFVWTPASNQFARLQVSLCCSNPGVPPTTTRYFRTRLVDTTISSPWFYADTGQGYQGYVELGNTTSQSVNVTVTIRASNGAVIGTPQTRSIPAFGNLLLNARTDFGTTITAAGGSVHAAHNGAPGAIVGNVTSLSAATGLSFDSPMTRRQNW